MDEYLNIVKKYIDECPYKLDIHMESIRKTYIQPIFVLNPDHATFDEYENFAIKIKLFTEIAGNRLPHLYTLLSRIKNCSEPSEFNSFECHVLFLHKKLLEPGHTLESLLLFDSFASTCTALGEEILIKYQVRS